MKTFWLAAALAAVIAAPGVAATVDFKVRDVYIDADRDDIEQSFGWPEYSSGKYSFFSWEGEPLPRYPFDYTAVSYGYDVGISVA